MPLLQVKAHSARALRAVSRLQTYRHLGYAHRAVMVTSHDAWCIIAASFTYEFGYGQWEFVGS